MIRGEHPLVEAVAYLEGLIARLEAGEAVRPLLDAYLEQQLRLLAVFVQEDVTEVRRVLLRLQEDPSSWHLRELQEAVDAVLAAAPEGPTRSPRANLLLGMALAACDDPSLDFDAQARQFVADLGFLVGRISAAAGGGASDLLREEADRLAGMAEAAHDALQGLADAVAGGSEDEVRFAGQGFIQAVRELSAVQDAFAELAHREGRTPCVKCGHFNAGERSTCERCNAVLPADAVARESAFDVRVGDEHASQAVMTENLARLFDACDRFYVGALQPEDFLLEVAWMEGLMAQAQRMGLGDSESARQGLEEFTSGLLTLRQAAETGDPALIERGRTLVWNGAGKLQAE